MTEDKVVQLRHLGSFSEDPLTEVLRNGARQLLAYAVEAEVSAFIAAHGDLHDVDGRRRIVRHGYLPEREIQTGIGAVRSVARGCATVAARRARRRSVSARRSCRAT